MATRNRTLLFLQYRASYVHNNHGHLSRTRTQASDITERVGLIAGAADIGGADDPSTVIEMSVLPPQWVDLTDEIKEDMIHIQEQIEALDELHRRQLLPGLEEGMRYERDIERKQAEITSAFRKCHEKIKRIGTESKKNGKTSGIPTSEEERLGQNVRTALAKRLQEMSSVFRRKQTGFLQKLKQREARTRGLLFDSALESGQADGELETSYSKEQIALVDDATEVIQRRDREIQEITRSISDLATIFQELQTLVIDQGTLLDRIDYNIEQVHTHTHRAVEELDKAEHYQKRSQKTKLILLLILMIIALILVIIFKPRRNAVAAPSDTITESVANVMVDDAVVSTPLGDMTETSTEVVTTLASLLPHLQKNIP